MAVAVNLSPARDSLLDSVSFKRTLRLVPDGTSSAGGLGAGLRSLGLVWALAVTVSASSTNDPASKNFYLRTKGEMERELAKLPFKALHILRPSLLIGKRAEFRLGEAIGMKIAPVLDLLTFGPLRKYHSMQAEIAGKAMAAAAKSGKTGILIYEFDPIVTLAA